MEGLMGPRPHAVLWMESELSYLKGGWLLFPGCPVACLTGWKSTVVSGKQDWLSPGPPHSCAPEEASALQRSQIFTMSSCRGEVSGGFSNVA